MKLFAIADLHLEGGDDKPMSVFGPQWEGHFEKIRADWLERVGPDDLVLIPGDISWAMQLEHAMPDLERIAALPGQKVLLRGNHDFWWPGISRLRAALPKDMHAIQNDALRIGSLTIAGTRGWTLPGPGMTQEDARIYQRELTRLSLSLAHASQLGGDLIIMTHYPPVGENGLPTEVTQLIAEAKPRYCVYGHLHGAAGRNAFHGTLNGTEYRCVACDQLGFRLSELELTPRVSGAQEQESGVHRP